MKYSAHKQYYNEKGDEVPSVTTIIGILNKPALTKWANIMGFKRINTDAFLNNAADVGTLMHDCIEMYLSNKKFFLPEDKQHQKNTILKRLDGFLTWVNAQTEITPEMLEVELVTDDYGGTTDFYGKLNGENVILDFKTSNKIHASMFLQLAAYTIALEAKGYTVDAVGIVHVTEKKTTLHYKKREEIDKYIVAFEATVALFHSWYKVNIEDGWGNICAK